MACRSVQISLDQELLEEVDREAKAGRLGRSAVIRQALRAYLARKRQAEIDESYRTAYAGKADEVFADFRELLGSQAWPDE